MVTGNSGALKPGRKELYAVLSTGKNRLGEFELGLHGVRESTKEESTRVKSVTSERVSLFSESLGQNFAPTTTKNWPTELYCLSAILSNFSSRKHISPSFS